MDTNGHVIGPAFGTPPPVKARLLRRNFELPPIPVVAVNLLGLLAKDQVALNEVAATISIDATIAAEVLRAANTANYGVRGEVTSVHHATTLLGIGRIRALAATHGLRRYLGQALRLPAVVRCWRHNLACAAAAEQIALRLGGNAADAYVAGLLHDIGRLALIVAHPTQYPAFLDTADARGLELLALERELLGIDHCEAGLWFTQQLLLPQVFQDIAMHHHNPAAVGPTEMLARVGVACRLAEWMGFWVTAPSEEEMKAPPAIDSLLLPLPLVQRMTLLSEAAELITGVDEQVRSTESMFQG
ncbi:MAG TPA: HDOD domain-containing protein [Vicinamibacterales bacterium]|nr:HDOD domain-containing protein [Vicinamibacterales bacterium]